jgi:NAD(P)-dependent dehydrogenase (short-subunit alcohol dehydrogenase family)
LDLADGDAAERAFLAAQAEAGGSFDLLVNNAGYGVFAPVEAQPFAVWAAQLDGMLAQTVRLALLALPAMRARGGGAIVNVSSLAVEFPMPGMSGYNAAKAGLSAWSASLAYELEGSGVAVIDFRPGDFRTPFNTAVVRAPDAAAGAAAGAGEGVDAQAGADAGGSREARWERVWRRFEHMHDIAPTVEVAAEDLAKALRRGRSGVVRTGSFFQARLAPLLARLGSERVRRAVQARYFDLR